MKRNNSGYTGLILAVLVILGFVVYAWSQLADRNVVEPIDTDIDTNVSGKIPMKTGSKDQNLVDAVGKRGSGKVEDANDAVKRASGKGAITKSPEQDTHPAGPGNTQAADLVNEFGAKAGDTSYSVAERLKFAGQMRLQHGSAELGETEVPRQLLELLEHHSDSTEFRSGVIGIMKGMKSHMLIQPLAQRAASDDDAQVRRAALATLTEYRKDAEVRSTLKSIIDNDLDAEVQAKAREILDMDR